MSQRPRSEIEEISSFIKEFHATNTELTITQRAELTLEVLLDLRDTANEILAEMKKQPIPTYTPDELEEMNLR